MQQVGSVGAPLCCTHLARAPAARPGRRRRRFAGGEGGQRLAVEPAGSHLGATCQWHDRNRRRRCLPALSASLASFTLPSDMWMAGPRWAAGGGQILGQLNAEAAGGRWVGAPPKRVKASVRSSCAAKLLQSGPCTSRSLSITPTPTAPPAAMECTVDRGALLKIVLHAAKYPTTACNGVLIGTVRAGQPPSGSPPTSPRGATAAVHVFDAIPLCHNFITLTPMLECALAQVRTCWRGGGAAAKARASSHCPSATRAPAHPARSLTPAHPHRKQVAEHARQQPQKEVRVVGYYQCNEQLEDTELSGAGRRIADRIEQLYPDSVALVVSQWDGVWQGRCGWGRSSAQARRLTRRTARGGAGACDCGKGW